LTPQAFAHAPEARLDVTGEALLAHAHVEQHLAGEELLVAVERVSAFELPREVAGAIALAGLNLAPGREHPLFVTARQRDQSRVWTSALFLTPA
jgi:hypothetical protein